MTDVTEKMPRDVTESRRLARTKRLKECRRLSVLRGLRLLRAMNNFVLADDGKAATLAVMSMEIWARNLADTLGERDELSGGKDPETWGEAT